MPEFTRVVNSESVYHRIFSPVADKSGTSSASHTVISSARGAAGIGLMIKVTVSSGKTTRVEATLPWRKGSGWERWHDGLLIGKNYDSFIGFIPGRFVEFAVKGDFAGDSWYIV